MILWIILAKRLPRIAGSQPALPCRSFSVAGPRGRVTRRQHREESRYFSQKAVTVQGTPSPRLRRPKEGMARVFAVFALRSLGEGGPGTNFIEHYECRGTNLIANHTFIPVYKILCVALVRSGFVRFYEVV